MRDWRAASTMSSSSMSTLSTPRARCSTCKVQKHLRQTQCHVCALLLEPSFCGSIQLEQQLVGGLRYHVTEHFLYLCYLPGSRDYGDAKQHIPNTAVASWSCGKHAYISSHVRFRLAIFRASCTTQGKMGDGGMRGCPPGVRRLHFRAQPGSWETRVGPCQKLG